MRQDMTSQGWGSGGRASSALVPVRLTWMQGPPSPRGRRGASRGEPQASLESHQQRAGRLSGDVRARAPGGTRAGLSAQPGRPVARASGSEQPGGRACARHRGGIHRPHGGRCRAGPRDARHRADRGQPPRRCRPAARSRGRAHRSPRGRAPSDVRAGHRGPPGRRAGARPGRGRARASPRWTCGGHRDRRVRTPHDPGRVMAARLPGSPTQPCG